MLRHLDWKENYHIVFDGTLLSNSCFSLRDLFAVLRTSRPGRFCTPNRIASRTPDGSELVPDRKPLCALHGFVVATPCGGGAQGVALPILLRRMIIVFNLASKLRGYVATHPLEKNDHSHHMSNATEMIIAIIPASKLPGYLVVWRSYSKWRLAIWFGVISKEERSNTRCTRCKRSCQDSESNPNPNPTLGSSTTFLTT